MMDNKELNKLIFDTQSTVTEAEKIVRGYLHHMDVTIPYGRFKGRKGRIVSSSYYHSDGFTIGIAPYSLKNPNEFLDTLYVNFRKIKELCDE